MVECQQTIAVDAPSILNDNDVISKAQKTGDKYDNEQNEMCIGEKGNELGKRTKFGGQPMYIYDRY